MEEEEEEEGGKNKINGKEGTRAYRSVPLHTDLESATSRSVLYPQLRQPHTAHAMSLHQVHSGSGAYAGLGRDTTDAAANCTALPRCFPMLLPTPPKYIYKLCAHSSGAGSAE